MTYPCSNCNRDEGSPICTSLCKRAVVVPPNAAKQRADRIAQAKHRGTKSSHKTELENLQLLLCWESMDLSEGQLSKLLDVDRVTLRQMRIDAIEAGLKLAEQLSR